MREYRLKEADNKKERFFKKHPNLTPEQKEELIELYSQQYIPDDIIDWNIFNSFSYEELHTIVDTFIKDREEKINKKNLSKAIEGRDYIKIFENKNSEGTEYLYLPLTWIGSKYLASDHFLPKIKVPSKVMQARDFEEGINDNEALLPGAKWCISLWTLPDLIIDDIPLKDENGKEFRHEGKEYWLDYTYKGYYFLFYFRDYNNLDDINKKIAFTLVQGFSKIEEITLADDTRGEIDSDIERVQKYWDKHYKEYESHIEHMGEVSIKERPKFKKYEKQKQKEAFNYAKYFVIREYLTYNEETGRYDSKGSLSHSNITYIVEDGEFIIPLGVINGNFNCSRLGLKTLKNCPKIVEGDFDCSKNNLTSLINPPERIEGSFNCSDNLLTSLKYAPKNIGGSFNCSLNHLKTLRYAPSYVKGSFYCSFNHLKTLRYAPKKVGGAFYCENSQLLSLKGAPKYIEGVFVCHSNQLTSLRYAPKEVKGDFICKTNNLVSLKGAPKYVGGDFECSSNDLKTLRYVPKYIGGGFNCSYNKLKTLKGAPQSIESFICNGNELISLKGAPEYVKGKFGCSYNKLISLEGSPKEVGRWFNCSGNPLTSLKGSPQKVGGCFNCSHNELTTLEGSPKEVGGYFDCSWNRLSTLEYAPKEVGGIFCCNGNPLHSKELSTEVKGIVY